MIDLFDAMDEAIAEYLGVETQTWVEVIESKNIDSQTRRDFIILCLDGIAKEKNTNQEQLREEFEKLQLISKK